ncbi:hypothetical protein [Mangrovibacterium diazotrophicum]|uniref:Uncharacterized protein n=1 Tax=Mangrovibacterium diazotrophicum TaxID=1261403 RepID=A0A419W933_9BACT|nr:hypothetical protein [Mangrovibacterium diazotrophicum]RKD91934.1 hypothetical protein BC643_2303 [Mangrovibacterium diazotrophicum]
MFKTTTSRTFTDEQVRGSGLPLSEAITGTLGKLGFADIKQRGNTIKFKSNQQEDELESLQRRFGKAYIQISLGTTPTVSVVTDQRVEKLLNLFGNLFILTAFNIMAFRKMKDQPLFVGAINIIFLVILVLQLLRTRCNCKSKHKELLDQIEKDLESRAETASQAMIV